MSTIMTASREYASRPKDERFDSVQALVQNAAHDKQLSAERAYNLHDLQVVPVNTADHSGQPEHDSLRLQSPHGVAKFTHWSFGQTCRMLGAPASYLRELPPSIAADALNFGLQDSAPGTTANLLIKANGGEPIVRACTSDSYGRSWDSDLYGQTAHLLMQNGRWELSEGYRGDRDSFLTITDKNAVITDPSVIASAERGDIGGIMYRGLMIRNSEVGASSVVIEAILYRLRCKNMQLWGSVVDTRFRRRHVGSHVTRDVVREIGRIALQWAEASPARDNAIIRTLIDREIAHTKEAVIDELRKMGATKDQAESAYMLCEQTERVSPRSFWGAAQGLTRLSQQAGYQDERYDLDRLAASIMAKGAKLVTA